jgi:hypothetical protein
MQNGLFFHIKNNETCETGCFVKHEISRNGQLVSRNNKTRFASSFAKQEAKRVSLETLCTGLGIDIAGHRSRIK